MPNLRFYDSMLFNYETSNRTDFQNEVKDCYPPTVYQKKVSRPRPSYKPLKDPHTLTEYKRYNLPTELFANRNQIVRTNPHRAQEVYTVSLPTCLTTFPNPGNIAYVS